MQMAAQAGEVTYQSPAEPGPLCEIINSALSCQSDNFKRSARQMNITQLFYAMNVFFYRLSPLAAHTLKQLQRR
jgi:hypothetical protein